MSRCKKLCACLLMLGVVVAFVGCKKPEGTGTAPGAAPAPAPSGTTDAP